MFLVYLFIATLALILIYYAWSSISTPYKEVAYLSASNNKKHWEFTITSPVKQEIIKKVKKEPLVPDGVESEPVFIDELEHNIYSYPFDESDEETSMEPPSRPMDQTVYPNKSNYWKNFQRLVHLDLKGAPPSVDYLEQLFPLLRTLGATGLLVEYEDMFPYSGHLSDLAAVNAYSDSHLKQILRAAKSNNLEVVPLVQTLGHMEFVLKHKRFSHLRENSFTPQAITPSNESYVLINSMIDQVISGFEQSLVFVHKMHFLLK